MSIDALESMNEQMTAAVELSPASQEFILDPAGSAVPFWGIYDNSHIEDNKDSGNVKQNKRMARVQVSEILSGFIRDAVVENAAGTKSWTVSKADIDDEGIPILWLV